MKRLLIILLLLPVIAFGQWVGGPGEYYNGVLNTSTHKAYTLDNGVPTLVTQVSNASQIIGGPHSMAIIDSVGNVWSKGQNKSGVVPCGSATDQANFVKCMTDSAGNTIDPVVQVVISGNGNHNISNDFWDIFAVTSSGKLYAAGELEGYVRGDGTPGLAVNTRWVRIFVGSGVDTFVTKVQGGYGMLAMTSAGSVYTWGGDRDGYINAQNTTTAATIPTKVTLPGGKTALDITSNGLVHAVILSDSNQAMTGSQNQNDYTGIYPTAMTRVFQDVTSALALPAKPKAVFMNSSTTYWILRTGALWAHGDNSCGTIGNGDMLDWSAYKCCPGPSSGSPAPYNYDNGFHEHMVIHPVEVVPGKFDWTGVSVCPSNSWFVYAYDAQGNFISWGRNKFGPLGNGIIGAAPVIGEVGANFPDSWTRPLPTVQNLAAILSYVQSTSPYCILNPTATHCPSYTETDVTKPVAALTGIVNGSLITWDASASTDNTGIVDYVHTQTAGTALQYKIRTGKKDSVMGVSSGSYTSKIVVKDRAFNADSTNATVCVGCSPTVSAGSNQTISLPTSSIGLTGTAMAAAGNGWASMTYLWTKVSGPGSTTISGNTTLTPTMSGLQAGVYVFQLRATDVNSNTNTSTAQVTVSGSGNCFCSYFFAASGSDANPGTSVSPFQTLTKLNSLASDTSASFYLNGGDTWYGGITGFKGKRLDSYGTGQAIVSGFITLSSWINEGGGIYSAPCPGCSIKNNLLTINGAQQPIARDPDNGYYSFETSSGHVSITDNQLTGSPDHSSGYLVIRNNHFTETTNKITSISGTTINYTSVTTQAANPGYGYFFFNDSLSLTVFGEWWLSAASGRMKVFFGGSGPGANVVKTTNLDTLLRIADGAKGVTINNIDFEGAGIMAVYIGVDTNTTVSNCTMRYSGGSGILDDLSIGTRLVSNYIDQSNDNAILIQPTVKNNYTGYNTVKNSGLLPGHGRNVPGFSYTGIRQSSVGGITEFNRVDSVGYDGIYGYQDSSINNNWVTNALLVLDDGAGIYHLGFKADSTKRNIIRHNIVTDIPGNVQGTADLFNQSFCIYSDNTNVNQIIDSNVCARSAYAGIFLHNTRTTWVLDNTIYDCASGIDMQGDNPANPMTNLIVKRNIIGLTAGANKFVVNVSSFNGYSYFNLPSFDSNYYSYPRTNATPFRTFVTSTATLKNYAQWQGVATDTRARQLDPALLFQYNTTATPVQLALTANYVNALNIPFYTSTAIPAFAGLLLFQGNYFRIRRNSKIKFQ